MFRPKQYDEQRKNRQIAILKKAAEGNKATTGFFILLLCVNTRNTDAPLPSEIILSIRFLLSCQYQLTSLDSQDIPTILAPLFFHPVDIIRPALFGNADAMNYHLEKDPKLLLCEYTAIDHLKRLFTGTAFQAAITVNDSEMCEQMLPYFVKQKNGIAIMQKQFKNIYKHSLERYLEIQTIKQKQAQNKVEKLKDQAADNLELIKATHDHEQIKKRCEIYQLALDSEDARKIFEAHAQAQIDNKFNFKPYVDAILSATQDELEMIYNFIMTNTTRKTREEIARAAKDAGVSFTQTDETRNKQFNELTLIEKFNRFREEFVVHIQKEIIFNPNHIQESLEQNDRVWNEVEAGHAVDPKYIMRSIVFIWLEGWTQRKSSESVKQDIRQGPFYLAMNGRTRPSRFNFYHSSILKHNTLLDISMYNSQLVDGLGITFGSFDAAGLRAKLAAVPLRHSAFSKLMSSKNKTLLELIKPPPKSGCVIS